MILEQNKLEKNKFFPVDALCPKCSYDLNTHYIPECPECGTPLEHYAYEGSIVQLDENHREAFPSPLAPRPDRYWPYLSLNPKDWIPVGIVSGILLYTSSLIVCGYLNIDFQGKLYNTVFQLKLVAISCVVGFGFLLVMNFILGKVRARSQARAFNYRINDGRVERCHFTIDRALKMNSKFGRYLFLNTTWNGLHRVMLIPPESIERLNIDFDSAIGCNGTAELFLLQGLYLKFETHGQPVTTRVSNQPPKRIARQTHSIKAKESEDAFMPPRKSIGSYFTSDDI